VAAVPRRYPPWLRKRLPPEAETRPVRDVLGRLRLETVCQNAACPNLWECFGRGTATFLILGRVCTRACGYCAVSEGVPGPVDAEEPGRVAEAAAALKLRHVVVTSVTRDDLADGGSAHFAATIAAIRERTANGANRANEAPTIEVLTPDFQGREEDILRVVQAGPDVYNHNVETVPRLYPLARPQARYERSLDLLRVVAAQGGLLTKSGLMVGLGERHEEVLEVMAALREAGCDALTIGQYLRPSAEHLPVERFVPPEEFDAYDAEARALGFRAVAAGPFVRSSYHADALLEGLAPAGAC